MKPILVVRILTYNHENYIRQCLESVVIQKTNFLFKVIIGEDCSTDNTAIICKEFEKLYPGLIELHCNNINNIQLNSSINWDLCINSGARYIALIEGDDYWTDPYKLQKQVDFLEVNAECNYVFTNRSTLKSDESIDQTDYNLPELFDLHFLLKQNIMPSTQTVLFRSSSLSQLAKWEPTLSKGFNGDWILLFMITQNSKIGFLKDNTAVYREGVGVISKTNNAYKFIKGLNTNKQIDYLTNYKYTYHIGVYDFHYQNITYSYLESNEKLKGLKWFFKTEFYKLFNGKSESFFTRNNWNFIKHSIKLLVKTN
jgi:glycosyltransferase involved in cell wall biosynthesis